MPSFEFEFHKIFYEIRIFGMPVVLCSSQNFIILCLVNLTYHLTSAVQPQFFQLGTILFQGQMELKVKQLEEAQSRLKVKAPEAMPNESHSNNGGRIGGKVEILISLIKK